MQILIEGLALAAFQRIRDYAKNRLAANPLGQGLFPSLLHQEGGPAGDRGLLLKPHDVLVGMQLAQHFGFRPDAVGMGLVDGDFQDELFVGALGLDEQGIRASTLAQPFDHLKAAVQQVAGTRYRRVGVWCRGGLGWECFLFRLVEIIQKLARIAGTIPNNRGGGGPHQLLKPLSDAIHGAGEPQSIIFAEVRGQIERIGDRGPPGEHVEGDRAQGEHIGLGRAFFVSLAGLGGLIKLCRIGQMIFDVLGAHGRRHARAAALTAAGDLPVGDLEAGRAAVRIAHQNVLRGETTVEEALAMDERHRLAELAHQPEPFGHRQKFVILGEIAVEAFRIRIMLEDQCRSKFRFPIIEDPLDALVLDALQHPELALRRAGEAVARLGRRGARVGIDADAAGDAGGGMFGGEVLPVPALGQQFIQFVVADATASAWRTNARLLNGADYRTYRVEVDLSEAAKAVLFRVQKNANQTIVVFSAWTASQDHPFCRANVDLRRLFDIRQKNQRFDPWRGTARPASAAQSLLPAKDGRQTFGFAVRQGEWVVGRDRATFRHPGPTERIASDGAGPGLDLDQNQARGGQDEEVHLVYAAFIVDELKVRPGTPGVAIGEMAAREVQRVALPRERTLADGGPARRFHRVELALRRQSVSIP